MTNIKFKVFGKVRKKKLTVKNKRLSELQERKCQIGRATNNNDEEVRKETLKQIDQEMSEELKSIQRSKFKENINRMNELKEKKGPSAAVFHLREDIIGGKKAVEEPAVVTNPETGEDVDTPKQIKKVTLQYCKQLLTKRKPKEEYREDIEVKELLHDLRMKE